MTTSSDFDGALEPERSLSGNHFLNCDEPREASRSMRVLERLAGTLGMPVAAFFEENAWPTSSDEATAQDVADLTRAFLAISDPEMRRYCLDIVRAAGTEDGSDRPSTVTATT